MTDLDGVAGVNSQLFPKLILILCLLFLNLFTK